MPTKVLNTSDVVWLPNRLRFGTWSSVKSRQPRMQCRSPAFSRSTPGYPVGVVLVVAVHRHDAGAFGTVVQKPPESGLQSRALPPVPLMMEQMNFGMSRGGVREIM